MQLGPFRRNKKEPNCTALTVGKSVTRLIIVFEQLGSLSGGETKLMDEEVLEVEE